MPPRSWRGLPSDLSPSSPGLDLRHLLTRLQPHAAFDDRRSAFDQRLLPGDRSSPRVSQAEKVESLSGVGGLARPMDVTIYVGRNRTPYVQSMESLKGSSYFRTLFEGRSFDFSARSPIVLDCEESVFQNMITILRYGSFDALPQMPESELFKLKRELHFYGIQVSESPEKSPSPSSSPAGSVISTRPMPAASSPRASEITPQQFSLTELPNIPVDLTDPAKLVLVSRLEDDVRGRCPCVAEGKPSQWALSFHHRHAFCTGCGRPPASMAPKFFAEMFMAAAGYFCGTDMIKSMKWLVGGDSTCTLKFISSRGICSCPCPGHTHWAVSTYHSHAFCTHCGNCAASSALVSILLTVRYGGPLKSPTKAKLSPNSYTPSSQGAPSRLTGHGGQRSVQHSTMF